MKLTGRSRRMSRRSCTQSPAFVFAVNLCCHEVYSNAWHKAKQAGENPREKAIAAKLLQLALNTPFLSNPGGRSKRGLKTILMSSGY